MSFPLEKIDPIPWPPPDTSTPQAEPLVEEPAQIDPESGPTQPSRGPTPEPPQGCPARIRRFPRAWKDYEATSYTPITTVAPVNEEIMEQTVKPSIAQRPEALSTPDMAEQDPH